MLKHLFVKWCTEIKETTIAPPARKASLESECTHKDISLAVYVWMKGIESNSWRQLESSQELPHLVEQLLKGRLRLWKEDVYPPAVCSALHAHLANKQGHRYSIPPILFSLSLIPVKKIWPDVQSQPTIWPQGKKRLEVRTWQWNMTGKNSAGIQGSSPVLCGACRGSGPHPPKPVGMT